MSLSIKTQLDEYIWVKIANHSFIVYWLINNDVKVSNFDWRTLQSLSCTCHHLKKHLSELSDFKQNGWNRFYIIPRRWNLTENQLIDVKLSFDRFYYGNSLFGREITCYIYRNDDTIRIMPEAIRRERDEIQSSRCERDDWISLQKYIPPNDNTNFHLPNRNLVNKCTKPLLPNRATRRKTGIRKIKTKK